MKITTIRHWSWAAMGAGIALCGVFFALHVVNILSEVARHVGAAVAAGIATSVMQLGVYFWLFGLITGIGVGLLIACAIEYWSHRKKR